MNTIALRKTIYKTLEESSFSSNVTTLWWGFSKDLQREVIYKPPRNLFKERDGAASLENSLEKFHC